MTQYVGYTCAAKLALLSSSPRPSRFYESEMLLGVELKCKDSLPEGAHKYARQLYNTQLTVPHRLMRFENLLTFFFEGMGGLHNSVLAYGFFRGLPGCIFSYVHANI